MERDISHLIAEIEASGFIAIPYVISDTGPGEYWDFAYKTIQIRLLLDRGQYSLLFKPVIEVEWQYLWVLILYISGGEFRDFMRLSSVELFLQLIKNITTAFEICTVSYSQSGLERFANDVAEKRWTISQKENEPG